MLGRRTIRKSWLWYLSAYTILALGLTAGNTRDAEQFIGPRVPIPASYFGLHIHRAANDTTWPPVSFSAWRLWDAGVTWPQLQPERARWDFTLLDRYVQIATDRHVDILLTLGLTPSWASSHPEEPSAYARGNAAPPSNIQDWENYVRTVATRYRGIVHEYEIWNEPNVKGTFTGAPADMVQLSRVAYRTLKSVDPGIVVVSPAATASDGIAWLDAFLRNDGCQYFDVLGYHFYVTPGPPEEMVSLIREVRHTVQRYKCADKPLWNTESGWTKPKYFASDEEAAGFLMRTFLLNWVMDVRRCYWYAWDNHNWSTLDLTSRTTHQITEAGRSYDTIRQWLLGATMASCDRNGAGVWICKLQREHSIDRVAWREKGEGYLLIPPTWKVRRIVSFTGSNISPTSQIDIGVSPVLLSSGE